jgi:hypothetical protein
MALAGLIALLASPATAACYGGPAAQTCNETYRDSDASAGVTTLRGYSAESGVERSEPLAGSSASHGKADRRVSARSDRAAPRHRSSFYVCTPYRGCS